MHGVQWRPQLQGIDTLLRRDCTFRPLEKILGALLTMFEKKLNTSPSPVLGVRDKRHTGASPYYAHVLFFQNHVFNVFKNYILKIFRVFQVSDHQK